jgi:glucose dehydrogenase
MYICAGERQAVYSVREVLEPVKSGDAYSGGSMRFAPIPTTGIVTAMDLRTNRRLWSQRWPSRCYSGLVATAGGLLFAGRNDGRLTALDARDGSKLWEFMTDAGVNAPATVFEHNGKQYVVVFSAGSLLGRGERGDSVWLFALLDDAN